MFGYINLSDTIPFKNLTFRLMVWNFFKRLLDSFLNTLSHMEKGNKHNAIILKLT